MSEKSFESESLSPPQDFPSQKNKSTRWQFLAISVVVIGVLVVTLILLVVFLWDKNDGNKQKLSPPVAMATWPFSLNATSLAFQTMKNGGSAVDGVVEGCHWCELEQCDGSVGYGGSPDDLGQTTLDAMIMDAVTMNVGSVGYLKRVKGAIQVARHVMEDTTHTLIVGGGATDLAVYLGFPNETLSTEDSTIMHENWVRDGCSPNSWANESLAACPGVGTGCAVDEPFFPDPQLNRKRDFINNRAYTNPFGHDTIGMVGIDEEGNLACGTSTNGKRFKIHGRVGDSPIAGAGAYCIDGVGGATATGDGDIMMRFLPSYRAVLNMQFRDMSPTEAAEEAIKEILKYYPSFSGAVIVMDAFGSHGAAAANTGGTFTYSYQNGGMETAELEQVGNLDDI